MRSSVACGLAALWIAACFVGAAEALPADRSAGAAASLASRPASVPSSQPASAPSGWKLVYSFDGNAAKLGSEWLVDDQGTAEMVKGALVVKPNAGGSGVHSILKAPKVPGAVKVEFDATLEGDAVCDISVILNGDETGWEKGYLLQFGGMGNSYTGLKRAGAKTEAEADVMITPGQKYHMVAENAGGDVSLSIDGKEVYKYTDSDPLSGDGHDMIGFYTFSGKLTISRLAVYSRLKDGVAAASAPIAPVDEKAVAALIKQLGADDYKTREAATQALIRMGPAIHPILKAKLEEKGLDAETLSRIQLVLKKSRASK